MKAFALIFIVLLLFVILVNQAIIKQERKDFNKDILINYYGGTGCCETLDGCASGRTVSEEFCVEELNGQWDLNKICNTQSGDCY